MMYLLEIDVQVGVIAAAIFMLFVVMAWLLAEFKGMKEEIRERMGINNETIKLRLQAYERLTIFAERTGLKTLIGRIDNNAQSIAGLHSQLVESIKTEFEYNVSQQIYVSKELWKAIEKLKDQNIFIINQIAATLPIHANAIDFSKSILEYTITERSDLNTIVLDAIQFEAKKLLK